MMIDSFAATVLSYFALFISCVVGAGLITFVVLYIIDITQTEQAIRRNYPVIGRARYFFEHMGTFFRQYFFALDREELPFNRAIRSWIYRAAKDVDSSVAFGSTIDNSRDGNPIFLNAAYPALDEEVLQIKPKVIGLYCESPYSPHSYFNISAMSYGALSKVAVEALSRGAELAKCWLNTGEGGISPYHLKGNCDLVFQIGTAKYGVRDARGRFDPELFRSLSALPQVKMIELKLSQGAKPGKGGLLPGAKVTAEIATIRGIPAGEDSVSPNRHLEFQSDEGLLDFVAELKRLCGKPVGVKFVLGQPQWADELCWAIVQREAHTRPDFLTLDGGEGGTGAAPQPLMDFVGLPLMQSLPIVVAALQKHGLREQIRLIAAGKLVSPSAVAMALCAGADYVNSARGFLFSLGCIQALQCNKNTCPTGITTHDKRLQKGLNPELKSVRVAHYHKNMIKHVEMIAHSCGLKHSSEFTPQHVKI